MQNKYCSYRENETFRYWSISNTSSKQAHLMIICKVYTKFKFKRYLIRYLRWLIVINIKEDSIITLVYPLNSMLIDSEQGIDKQ